MFDENFNFGQPASPTLTSTTDSSTRDSSRSVSPCSPTSAFPPPRFSVTDLSAQFADSRIRNDSRIFTDSCAAYANTDDDEADWSIPSIEPQSDYNPLLRSRTFPARPSSPSRRTQRQVNSRLLCTSSHRQELLSLVSRMVESNDQCSISPTETEDEDYTSESPKSRRSSVAVGRPSRPDAGYGRGADMRVSGACVSKDTRFRRGSERKHQRLRSSEKA